MKTLSCIFLLVILLSALPSGAFGQSDISPGVTANQASAPALSPNASSVQNNHVDLFHGSLSVSIPLYTIKSKFLSVPISLNYSVPGQSSAETFHPGWVGLGWRLSAGGAITRTLRGYPDEAVCTVGNTLIPIAGSGENDPQDQFHFSFCGYSGTFFYHKGQLILDTEADITLLNPVSSGDESLSGFTLQTASGNLYTFGYSAHPTTQQKYAVERSRTIKGKQHSPYQNACITAWYLSSIESPEGDKITFHYEQEEEICSLSDQDYWSKITAIYTESEQFIVDYFKRTDNEEERTGTFITPAYLKSIQCDGTVEAEFIRTVATEKNYPLRYTEPTDSTTHFNSWVLDKIYNSRWHKLTSIRLKDQTNNKNIFKRFDLTYREDSTEILKLTRLQEKANNTTGLPAYSFAYTSPSGATGGIEALSKLTYPTGGYDLYTYARHRYLKGDNYVYEQGGSGLRIEKISSYSSAGEDPWITEYYYVKSDGGNFPGMFGSGIIGRKKNQNKTLSFGAMNGMVTWNKTGNYDMSSAFLCAPPAGQVGYSTVFTLRKRGSEQGEYQQYNFRNYDFDHDLNGQRYSFEKVGQLLSVSNSLEKTEYKYESLGGSPDTIEYTFDEYLPFNYKGKIGTGTYSKKYVWKYRFLHRKLKIHQIIKYVPGDPYEVLEETTLTYNPQTMNLVSSETVNRKENITYRTEYNYKHRDMHYYPRRVNVPYEIIRRKNGKVISGEISDFIERNTGWPDYRPYELPARKYIYIPTELSENYTYAVYDNGTVHKYGVWQEVIAYEYDDNNLLKKETPYLAEPSLYEWDTYHRLKSVTVGKMKTQYTYNIHGVTSVKQPNGISQSTEYNLMGQPILVRDDEGNILQKIDYTYNLNP